MDAYDRTKITIPELRPGAHFKLEWPEGKIDRAAGLQMKPRFVDSAKQIIQEELNKQDWYVHPNKINRIYGSPVINHLFRDDTSTNTKSVDSLARNKWKEHHESHIFYPDVRSPKKEDIISTNKNDFSSEKMKPHAQQNKKVSNVKISPTQISNFILGWNGIPQNDEALRHVSKVLSNNIDFHEWGKPIQVKEVNQHVFHPPKPNLYGYNAVDPHHARRRKQYTDATKSNIFFDHRKVLRPDSQTVFKPVIPVGKQTN